MNAADESAFDEQTQCVVDGLTGDGPERGGDALTYEFGRAVGMEAYRRQDGEPLGGGLDPVFSQQCCVAHGPIVVLIFDLVYFLTYYKLIEVSSKLRPDACPTDEYR